MVDLFNRFSPAIDPRLDCRGDDLVRTLEATCAVAGYPSAIRVDKGSEFSSWDLDLWAYTNGVTLDFSWPSKPRDNAYIAAFNGRVWVFCPTPIGS